MATVKRLIDANALGIGKAKREAFDKPAYADGWNSAIAVIEQAPTVDAVEVVHGRWIEKKLDNFRKWELTCSECGWVGISNYDAYDEPFDFNYCPNCGAKMDGVDEETQPDCPYNKDGRCIGQKLMPECDAKNCNRRK